MFRMSTLMHRRRSESGFTLAELRLDEEGVARRERQGPNESTIDAK